MSREILFRGKLKSWDGSVMPEWVEGGLLQHDVDGATIFYQHEMDGSLVGQEVDPPTVCQYMGITDKNGKKIFEGDIVYGRGNALSGRSEIIWRNGGYAIDDKKRRRTYSLFNSDWALRVDGNKWDNPELIDEEETN